MELTICITHILNALRSTAQKLLPQHFNLFSCRILLVNIAALINWLGQSTVAFLFDHHRTSLATYRARVTHSTWTRMSAISRTSE